MLEHKEKNMIFSERYGHTPLRSNLQIDSVDDILRNGLWNVLKIYCWDNVQPSTGIISGYYLNNPRNKEIQTLCSKIWFNYFKKPLDTLSDDWDVVFGILRKHFYESNWYNVYDFIEFIGNNYDKYQFKHNFMKACNQILEKEMSAYRFVNGLVTKITDETEASEIEKASNESEGPVKTHLRRSLELLSDRNSPDFRNSIKESISAVESFVALTLKTTNSTLGQLLNKLEKDISLHPALKSAFSSLYGYTSDEGGIRHALTEKDNVDFDDAKFMIVVCSAFINYASSKYKN
jgi:hypothetical protein